VLGRREGPSLLTRQPATNSLRHAFYAINGLGIATLRAISKSTLLLLVENFDARTAGPVDTSQNGLWTLGTDGTALTRLTGTAAHESISLCAFTQFPWSNISRDNHLYAYQRGTSDSSRHETSSILFGSLQAGIRGTPTIVASADTARAVYQLVGWITL
jgi:hypothetical protein